MTLNRRKGSLFLATEPARDGPLGFSGFLLDLTINLINTAVELLPIGIEFLLCFLAELINLFLALVGELWDAFALSTGFGDLELDGKYDMSHYLEL